MIAGPQPAGGTTTTTTTPVAAGVPLTSVPVLNSLPTATKRVFLDFNGADATTWGSYSVPTTPAYDTDGDTTTFSDTELSNINNIWARVSEKFAPFNINVTTVDPGSYASGQTLRVVIGGTSGWLGSAAGGVAYVNSFTSVSSAKQTVWIFPGNLGNGNPKYVAEASAHESGHGFGLQHQSTYDATGVKTNEYNPGTSAKAPIMGNSYSAARGLWWLGTSATNSTTIQDDVSVISRSTNGFGYRPDEAGDTPAAAAALTVSGGSASASGVIATTADVDYYAFDTGAGTVSFNGNVVASGATLDLKLSLYAADGSLVTSADTTALGESLSATVPAGTYRLAVASHGTYGDIGQYTVAGTVVAIDSVAAPTNLAAAATGTSVSLTWA
ncbi:MAG TPA: zinc-dependent metalloprotease family protein, partial [Humisphaera sp.]